MIIEEFKKKRRNSDKIDTYVVYICQNCGEKSETTKANYNKKKTGLCRPCSSSNTGLSKTGLESKTKGIPREHLRGVNSKNWRGGRYINSSGYVMVLNKHGSVGRSSGWENYRPEHIVVIEKHIGRKLEKDECVHHIDGDRQNNNIDNLVVIDSNKHHRVTHMSLQSVGYELYKKGFIIFNRDSLIYEEFKKQ